MNVSNVARVSVLKLLLVVLLVGFVPSPNVHAQTISSSEEEFLRKTMLALAIMERSFSDLRFTEDSDEVSRRAHQLFLQTLDPKRIYFSEEDIKELKKLELIHDDSLRADSLLIHRAMYELFKERVRDTYEYVEKYTSESFDLDLNTSELLALENETYLPAVALPEIWRKQVKYSINKDLASTERQLDETEMAEAAQELKVKFRNRHKRHKSRIENMSDDAKFELYLNAMLGGFDPHSAYFSKNTFKDFIDEMTLKLVGIGVSINEYEDGGIEINGFSTGGPAIKSQQLKVGDVVVGVGQGEKGEIIDIRSWRFEDAIRVIKGEENSTVVLEVLETKSNTLKTVTLVREKIEMSEQAARLEIVKSNESSIGVLQVPSFYAQYGAGDEHSLTSDVKELLQKATTDLDTLVVDLRGNGGGSLQEAIDFTQLFIGKRTVVRTKDYDDEVNSYGLEGPKAPIIFHGNLMVLVDRESASASEVFAGAIQDYGRGIIVGPERTHGKATVQTIGEIIRTARGQVTLSGLGRPGKHETIGGLKFTMQQFFLPAGGSNQKDGIAPDIVLNLSNIAPSQTHFEDSLPFAVGSDSDHLDASDTADFEKFTHFLDSNLQNNTVDNLRALSSSRRANSIQWQSALAVSDNIIRLSEQDAFDISQAKLRAIVVQLNELEKSNPRIPWPEERKKFGDSLMENEVLDIARDWASIKTPLEETSQDD